MAGADRTSVAHRINREAVVLIGWGRAILLQLAHPLVAAGVADYSGYRSGARGYLRRIRHTVGAMLTLSFGTPGEAREVIRRIRSIHDRVHGALPEAAGIFPAGTPYSAHDPALLLWVHATLIESLVLTYERLVGPLTPGERSAYVAEAAAVACDLGVPAGMVPRDYPALEAHLASRYARGEIVVTDRARALARAVLSPPLGPAAVPVFRLSRAITIGLLPEAIREGYGFPWDAASERACRRALAIVSRVRRLLPAALREWPAARAGRAS